VRVQFCGVRGSMPAPGHDFERYGGSTSCVALCHDDARAPSLLLDVGSGVRRATELLAGAPFLGSVLLSHLHWDHTQGIPFFGAGNRDGARVRVFVPDQGDGTSPEALIAKMMSPPSFPIGPEGLRGDWTFEPIGEGSIELEGFEIAALEVPHRGGRTFGYRVADAHSALAYLPDHCPTDFGAGPDGVGAYHDAAMSLARGVDALIHDAALIAEELAARAVYGHAAAEYAVGLGRAAGAGSVVCFHHAPDRSDEEIDAIWARLGEPPGLLMASEGLVLDL